MPRAFTGQRLEWTEANLQWAIESIKSNLTRDLVPPGWRRTNERNAMGGHCHNATGALYMLFGPEYLQIWKGDSPGPNGNALHFWVTRKDNEELIDITAAQYTDGYDYTVGTKSTMLGNAPYYNARELYNRVLNEYNNITKPLF